MLVEVSLLQRFVLLLGHPVYSLTVTLCSLLLGTGLGSAASRRLPDAHLRRSLFLVLGLIVALGCCAGFVLAPLIQHSIVAGRASRILIAAAVTLPVGLFLGIPLPAGMRLLARERQTLVPWAWGINGALSVVGTTVAVFIAMNWGFSASLLGGAALYAAAGALLLTRH